MEEIIAEKTRLYGKELEEWTQKDGPPPVTTVSLGNEDLGRIVSEPFRICFTPSRVVKSWEKIGAVPLTRKALTNKKVRHEVGGCAPQAARIGELQQCHEVNQEKARKLGMNVGNFTATAPVHTHIAREPDAVARVRKLAETGNITTDSLWHTVGAVAVNSWQVFAAQDAINAKAMKESATDAAAKAAADLVVLTEAENLANSSTLSDPNNVSDAQLNTAVKFIFVAKPEQPVVRSSIKGKAGKVAFLSGLTPAWHCLLAEARLACTAAVTAASTAMDEAEAAEAAVFINNQPPAPPSVVPGAVTADAVDVQIMSEAERRALLARLVDAGP